MAHKTLEDHNAELAEREHALRRVRELFRVASGTESGQPILHMITKNRKSASFVVQVFVIVVPSVTCVDISTEVATIANLGYSQVHRGVRIQALGTNVHDLIMTLLARQTHGFDAVDPLHYRSL